MEKDLKSFIRNNRSDFDTANPPEALWDRIAKSLDDEQMTTSKPRKLYFARLMRVAAAVLLLGIAGALVFTYGRKQGYEDYHRINPQLAAEQRSYADIVSQKKDSLAFIATTNPILYNEFSTALEQIEASYNTLKQELHTSPNQELTLEAMILNLRIQIEILEQQIDTYQNVKDKENQTHAYQL